MMHFSAHVSCLPSSTCILVLISLSLKPYSACALAGAYSPVPDCTLENQMQDLLPSEGEVTAETSP